MARCFTWLTMFLLAASPARAETPQDLSGTIYSIGRDLAKMQAQMEELRTMVAKLSEKGGVCREAGEPKQEDPPPPASVFKPTAPSLPDNPPPATRGTVSGQVVFDRVEGKIAYVYLADVVEAPVKGKVAEIRQKGFKFRPDHLVIQSGTRISFPNEDKIHHHVFSVTPASPFDLGYNRSDDPTPSQLFAAPGLVDINCNIHPAMNATVLVVPNRHWIQVQNDGSFTLVGVPLGRHTIKVWGPGAEIGAQQIMVQGDRTEHVSLKLEPRKRGSR